MAVGSQNMSGAPLAGGVFEGIGGDSRVVAKVAIYAGLSVAWLAWFGVLVNILGFEPAWRWTGAPLGFFIVIHNLAMRGGAGVFSTGTLILVVYVGSLADFYFGQLAGFLTWLMGCALATSAAGARYLWLTKDS